MANPYIDYYTNQAGSGLAVFSGSKFQRGNGFFGRILKFLKPALSFLAKQGLKSAVHIGNDLLEGESFSESAKRRLKETGRTVAKTGLAKVDEYADQMGTGYKRRKRVKRSVKRVKASKGARKSKPKAKAKARKTRPRKSINRSKGLPIIF